MENIHEFDDTKTEDLVVKQAFRITDDSSANWALRQLLSVRKKIKENRKLFESELARITSWLEKADESLAKDENYFVGILTEYANQVRTTENRKTITLPHGTIKTRASSAKVKVEDAEVFLGWAKATESSELIRVKEEPAVSVFKELFDIVGDKVVLKATGEVVQGVTVQPESTSITIESE